MRECLCVVIVHKNYKFSGVWSTLQTYYFTNNNRFYMQKSVITRPHCRTRLRREHQMRIHAHFHRFHSTEHWTILQYWSEPYFRQAWNIIIYKYATIMKVAAFVYIDLFCYCYEKNVKDQDGYPRVLLELQILVKPYIYSLETSEHSWQQIKSISSNPSDFGTTVFVKFER